MVSVFGLLLSVIRSWCTLPLPPCIGCTWCCLPFVVGVEQRVVLGWVVQGVV